MLRAYGISDKGRQRPGNEDCFAIDERLRLCVVADGMGGHNAGEVAARLAVDAVVDVVRDSREREDVAPDDAWPFGFDPSLSAAGNLLRTAIHMANLRIVELSATVDRYAGMGTTVVAVLVDGRRLSVGYAGDSRLYLVAANRLRQITSDDSWMATLLARNPALDPVVLQHHPMRNALTNVVGARRHTEVHVVEETLVGGELLLLSTDGVHGVLDARSLERLLVRAEDPREAASSLVNAAVARGSRDDCTAIVARYLPD